MTNNPLRYSDPTGHRKCEDYQGSCVSEDQATNIYKADLKSNLKKNILATKIHSKYNNVKIKDPTSWSIADLQKINYGLYMINGRYGFDGDKAALSAAFGNVTFVSKSFYGDKVGDALWSTGVINLEPVYATSDTVVHEMGHILDGTLRRQDKNLPMYSGPKMYGNVFDAGSGATEYAQKTHSPSEDFADSFLAEVRDGPNTGSVLGLRSPTIISIIEQYTYPDYVFHGK